MTRVKLNDSGLKNKNGARTGHLSPLRDFLEANFGDADQLSDGAWQESLCSVIAGSRQHWVSTHRGLIS